MRCTPCHGIRTRDRTLINLNNRAAISSPVPILRKVGTNSKVAISRAAINNKVAISKVVTSRAAINNKVAISSPAAINNPAGTSSPMDNPAINNHTERLLWAQQVLMALAR